MAIYHPLAILLLSTTLVSFVHSASYLRDVGQMGRLTQCNAFKVRNHGGWITAGHCMNWPQILRTSHPGSNSASLRYRYRKAAGGSEGTGDVACVGPKPYYDQFKNLPSWRMPETCDKKPVGSPGVHVVSYKGPKGKSNAHAKGKAWIHEASIDAHYSDGRYKIKIPGTVINGGWSGSAVVLGWPQFDREVFAVITHRVNGCEDCAIAEPLTARGICGKGKPVSGNLLCEGVAFG